MYIAGIPVGMLVDSKGPRPTVLGGSVILGLGYFFLYRGETLKKRSKFNELSRLQKHMREAPAQSVSHGYASSHL